MTTVNEPLSDVSNVARRNVNFKSSYCDAVQVEAFCDLNSEPSVGCVEIALLPPTSISPSCEIQTLYSALSDATTIQYSVRFCK